VFKSITVIDAGERWDYDYVASPGRRKEGDHKPTFEDKEEVYKIVHEIAQRRFGRALKRAKKADLGVGERVELKRGQEPTELAAQLKSRKKVPAQGATVELGFAESTVFAKQSIVPANVVIAGLGKYKEITEKLSKKGLDGPILSKAVMQGIATGKGDPDVMRLIGLLFGAEPARVPVAAVTAKLAVIALARGETTEVVFGKEGTERPFGGGIFPASARGAKKAAERAEATVIKGEEFPEGTTIEARAEEEVTRMFELVARTVRGKEFKDTAELKDEIVRLLDEFDAQIRMRKK
jgi:hypothetical protein